MTTPQEITLRDAVDKYLVVPHLEHTAFVKDQLQWALKKVLLAI